MKKYLILLIVVLFLGIFFMFNLLFSKANTYTSKFGYTPSQAINLLFSTRTLSAMQLSRYKKPTILVLGVDPRDDSLEKTEVSDTLMLLQLNLEKNVVSLVSLPRDTWYEKYKIKINKLYPLSLEKESSFDYLKTEFSNITGQKIDHVLIITTNSFLNIANAIGPVEVDLPYGFTDDRYPNPDYVKTPISSIPIYKTISFNQGKNIIDEKNVLEFVRSRKGSDNPAFGGTDIGRIGRQQVLLSVYMDNIKKNKSVDTLSKIYSLFKTIKNDISDQDLLLYGLSMSNPLNISVNKITLPINTKNDVIYDPGVLVEKQSVLLPRDSFKSLQIFLQEKLP